MKFHFKYIFPLFIPILLAACRGNNQAESNVSELPVFEFTNQDSLNIQALGEQFMSYFKAGDYEGASHMLYLVNNDSVRSLPANYAQGFQDMMSSMPIVDSELKELKLFSDRDNELRIALQISPEGDLSTGEGCINFVLNPVEQDGRWFLTLRDEYAEGVGLYH